MVSLVPKRMKKIRDWVALDTFGISSLRSAMAGFLEICLPVALRNI